jgi:hypothetical protein
MKIIAFRDIVPCSLVEVDRCFRGAYCLHHQVNEAIRTSETSVYFNVFEWLTILLFIREVPGLNLGPETGYSD